MANRPGDRKQGGHNPPPRQPAVVRDNQPKPVANGAPTPPPVSPGDQSSERKARSYKPVEILSVVIAVIAAAAASWQGWVSRDTEKRQLRAYVGIIPGDVENFGNEHQRLRLTRKNYGQTPAYDVGFSSLSFAIVAIGQPVPIQTMGCKPQPAAMRLITMFPSTELPFTIDISKSFPDDQLRDVRDGKAEFVYYGVACYNDAFEHAHYTNYCWMYTGLNMTAKDAQACLNDNDSN